MNKEKRMNELKFIINQEKRDIEFYKSYIEFCSLFLNQGIKEGFELTVTDLAVSPYANRDIKIVREAYEQLKNSAKE